MRTIVAIGIAGALGALAPGTTDSTEWSSRRFTASSIPWGTFVVNVSGAFVLGLVMTLMTEQLYDSSVAAVGAHHRACSGRIRLFRPFRTRPTASRRRRVSASRLRTCSGAWPPVSLRSTSESSQGGRCEELEGEGKLLRLFIGESDTWHGKPLYQAIVERVREEGLAGATVLRGIEGFGADSRLHTSRILRLSEDLPVVIEIVDTPEQIDRGGADARRDGRGKGLLTLERVQIVSYRSSDD